LEPDIGSFRLPQAGLGRDGGELEAYGVSAAS